jgi:hypothetical protein
MMDWEDVFTAVREETGQGRLYCLGFPRIVKDIFLGNISAARVACAEMQLRRPEVEEVYLQNCVGYRLNHAKPKQKEEENTMATKEEVLKDAQEEDHTIEIDESKELDREYSRLWYRMKVNYPKALSERQKGGTQQEFIDWVKTTYPDLAKPSTRGHKDEKKAPMTPPRRRPLQLRSFHWRRRQIRQLLQILRYPKVPRDAPKGQTASTSNRSSSPYQAPSP